MDHADGRSRRNPARALGIKYGYFMVIFHGILHKVWAESVQGPSHAVFYARSDFGYNIQKITSAVSSCGIRRGQYLINNGILESFVCSNKITIFLFLLKLFIFIAVSLQK